MFDTELFTINRDYFNELDESPPIDPDVEAHTEALNRIDRELARAGHKEEGTPWIANYSHA